MEALTRVQVEVVEVEDDRIGESGLAGDDIEEIAMVGGVLFDAGWHDDWTLTRGGGFGHARVPNAV